MRSYQFLSHIADVRLQIEADSLEELFTAGLEGMCSLIKNEGCPFNKIQGGFEDFSASSHDHGIIKEKIEISSIDTTSLLIDFLSEVLTHIQVNKAVYCKIKFDKITNNFLKATIFGIKVDHFDQDIKAVTYHEAEIKKDEKGKYQTIIIFDI